VIDRNRKVDHVDPAKNDKSDELKRIGKYVVMEVLGRGGMGVVYRALDNQLGREVAIKTLTRGVADDPEMLARFYEEGRKTARLKHPHIVTVYDLGEENGIPYIVMERVEGDSLEKLIRDNSPLSVMDRLRIVGEMCEALGYAHSSNVIHRDVKPANIFVEPSGNSKLLDFGIARLEKRSQELSLTRTGHIVGTVPYIAPERLKDKFIDGRSDIFSIGVVLYQLLTGQLPFSGEDYVLMQKIMSEPHPPLSSLCDFTPPGVEAIVDRSLAKLPDDRYQTAEEMAADIDSVIEDLRQQEVVDLVPKARQLLEVRDLTRARIVLQQVLKVQSRNTEARELLSEVQRQLGRRQRDERLEQIRQQAEEALRNREFDEGISVLKEGLALDSADVQLVALLEKTKDAKKKKEQIDELVRRVDAARRKGDYQSAIASAQEALKVDKVNSKLINLCSSLVAEAEQVQRKAQARTLLDDARRHLQGRSFERVLEILVRAEELSPSEPEIHILRADANAGFEQSRRKGLIARLEDQVSIANSIEQLQLCVREIKQAMVNMPSEPALVRLNAQVERRLREMESIRLVEGTIQACRDLRPREALELVRRSRQQLPTDERLLSLEARLNERIQQLSGEERRAEYLARADQALKASRFRDAVHLLEACQAENLGGEEVTALLQFARNEDAEHNREQLKRNTLQRAQCLMDEGAFDEAIDLLGDALLQSDDTTLRLLMSQASSAREAVLRQVEGVLQSAGKLIRANKSDDAAKLLKSLPKEVLRSPRVQTAVIMLDDESNDVLYRHVGRAYALLNSDPSASKTIAQRVGAASDPASNTSALVHALDARIRH
jgi:serine/threonine protein kinase